MTHDEAYPLLDAHLDDELDIAASTALQAHISRCNACTEWLAARRALRTRVRSAALRHPVPPALPERIKARWTRPRSLRAFRSPWAQSLAAGLLLAVGGFFLGHTLPHSATVNDQLVSAHLRSLLSPQSVDVRSSDHHTVKPWFAGKVPFAPPVPELTERGDVLLGGRVDYVEHTRIAALVYQHGNHSITVFIWPRGTQAIPGASNASLDGYHLVTADIGPFSAAMVSDMSIDELTAFRHRWSETASRR